MGLTWMRMDKNKPSKGVETKNKNMAALARKPRERAGIVRVAPETYDDLYIVRISDSSYQLGVAHEDVQARTLRSPTTCTTPTIATSRRSSRVITGLLASRLDRVERGDRGGGEERLLPLP